MSFAKKVAVAVDMENDQKELFSALKTMDFLNHSEVHFIHISQIFSYNVALSGYPLIYPLEDDRKKISDAINNSLKELAQSVLPSDFNGEVKTHCKFAYSPKETFCEYLKDEKADLAIIAAREKKGFFESSFANYIGKNSKANLVIIKHIN